ncbi:MAG: hypothetical protein ACXVA9_13200 [Bdellovibrionales bacterium]
MLRSLLLTVCMVAGAAASAKSVTLAEVVARSTAKIIKQNILLVDQFNVGDTNNYELTVSSFKGTMIMKVTGVTASELTIEQDISIAGQNQNAIEVVNPNTGEIISLTVNGQKQNVPPAGDTEIISHTSATITVPAGTFNCQDVKTHSKSENSDAEQWIDMGGTVPVGGMLKMATTAQGMDVVAVLTQYTH